MPRPDDGLKARHERSKYMFIKPSLKDIAKELADDDQVHTSTGEALARTESLSLLFVRYATTYSSVLSWKGVAYGRLFYPAAPGPRPCRC